MRTLPRSLVALSTMALASAGMAVGATTASAALTTYCDGDAADVTVPGDLVVAEGNSCILDNVTIDGKVQVMSGADLLINGSTVNDAIIVSADGYFDATDSDMTGSVTNSGGYGVYLDGASVGGVYLGEADEDADTFLYSFDGSFGDGIDIAQGLVHLESAQIVGDVATDNATYTDIVDSTLTGDLTVTGSPEGSAICETEVDGVATFTGNGQLQIGTGLSLVPCEGVNYFGSDVLIDDNTGGVDVTGNIIRGDLTGEGNDPAPTGSDNRVRGESGGQFTELAPAAQSMATQSEFGPDHSEQLKDKRDERRASAEKDAELAGPAYL